MGFTERVWRASIGRRLTTEAFLTCGAKRRRVWADGNGFLIAKGSFGIYSCGGKVTVPKRRSPRDGHNDRGLSSGEESETTQNLESRRQVDTKALALNTSQ